MSLTTEQKAHVDKWLEVLRAGTHEQGEGMLKKLKGGHPYYCCLGVAAEAVLAKQFLPLPYNPDELGYEYQYNRFSSTELANVEAEKLGLDKKLTEEESNELGSQFQAEFPTFSRQSALITLNDSVGLSFEEIADVIEEMGWNK